MSYPEANDNVSLPVDVSSLSVEVRPGIFAQYYQTYMFIVCCKTIFRKKAAFDRHLKTHDGPFVDVDLRNHLLDMVALKGPRMSPCNFAFEVPPVVFDDRILSYFVCGHCLSGPFTQKQNLNGHYEANPWCTVSPAKKHLSMPIFQAPGDKFDSRKYILVKVVGAPLEVDAGDDLALSACVSDETRSIQTAKFDAILNALPPLPNRVEEISLLVSRNDELLSLINGHGAIVEDGEAPVYNSFLKGAGLWTVEDYIDPKRRKFYAAISDPLKGTGLVQDEELFGILFGAAKYFLISGNIMVHHMTLPLRSVLKNLPHQSGLIQFHTQEINFLYAKTLHRYASVVASFLAFYIRSYLSPRLQEKAFAFAEENPIALCTSIVEAIVWCSGDSITKPLVIQQFLKGWMFHGDSGDLKTMARVSTDIAALLKFLFTGNAFIIEKRNLSVSDGVFLHQKSDEYLSVVMYLSLARKSLELSPNRGLLFYEASDPGFKLVFVENSSKPGVGHRSIIFQSLLFSPTLSLLSNDIFGIVFELAIGLLEVCAENEEEFRVISELFRAQRSAKFVKVASLCSGEIISFESRQKLNAKIDRLLEKFSESAEEFLSVSQDFLMALLALFHIRQAGPPRATEYLQFSLLCRYGKCEIVPDGGKLFSVLTSHKSRNHSYSVRVIDPCVSTFLCFYFNVLRPVEMELLPKLGPNFLPYSLSSAHFFGGSVDKGADLVNSNITAELTKSIGFAYSFQNHRHVMSYYQAELPMQEDILNRFADELNQLERKNISWMSESSGHTLKTAQRKYLTAGNSVAETHVPSNAGPSTEITVALAAYSIQARVLGFVTTPPMVEEEESVSVVPITPGNVDTYISASLEFFPKINALRAHQIQTLHDMLPPIFSNPIDGKAFLGIISQPCGSGKSLYPALIAAVQKARGQPGRVLLVTSTNVLCTSTSMSLSDLTEGKLNIRVFDRKSAPMDFLNIDICIVNPERINTPSFQKLVEKYEEKDVTFSCVFFDEAHNFVSQLSFRHSWARAGTFMSSFAKFVPIILMSGTLTDAVTKGIFKLMPEWSNRAIVERSLPIFDQGSCSRVTDQLWSSEKDDIAKEAWTAMTDVVRNDEPIQRILIICLTRNIAEEVFDLFESRIDGDQLLFCAVRKLSDRERKLKMKHKKELSSFGLSREEVTEEVEKFAAVPNGVAVLIGTSSILEGVSFSKVTGVVLAGGVWSTLDYVQARFRVSRKESDPAGICVLLETPLIDYFIENFEQDSSIATRKKNSIIPEACTIASVAKMIGLIDQGHCFLRCMAEMLGVELPPACKRCDGCLIRRKREKKEEKAHSKSSVKKRQLESDSPAVSKIPRVGQFVSDRMSSINARGPEVIESKREVVREERSEVDIFIDSLPRELNFFMDASFASSGSPSYAVLGFVPVLTKLYAKVFKKQCLLCQRNCDTRSKFCKALPGGPCTNCLGDTRASGHDCSEDKKPNLKSLWERGICAHCFFPHADIIAERLCIGSEGKVLQTLYCSPRRIDAEYFIRLERLMRPCVVLWRHSNDLNPVVKAIFAVLPESLRRGIVSCRTLAELLDWALDFEDLVGPIGEQLKVVRIHAVLVFWDRVLAGYRGALKLNYKRSR